MPNKRRLTPEEVERKYLDIILENYVREAKQDLADREARRHDVAPAKIPKGANHTRSSFAFARASLSKTTDKVLPINLVTPSVDFLPGGQSGCYDIVPQFRTKDVVEHWVIMKRGKRELLVARGFTRCCGIGRDCQNDRCAKCWVLKQKAKKGWRYLVREVITGNKPKVVDPFGVNPTGKRSMGKDMHPDDRAKFRLTSSIFDYKKGASRWR